MARNNKEEIAAFAKKMQEQGAAGFAAGVTPWETWDDFEIRVGSRLLDENNAPAPEQIPAAPKSDRRTLTTMSAITVAALAIGMTGVYFTQSPTEQLAANSIQAQPQSRDSTQSSSPNLQIALNEGPTASAELPASVPATTAVIDTTSSPVATTTQDSALALPAKTIDASAPAPATGMETAATMTAMADAPEVSEKITPKVATEIAMKTDADPPPPAATGAQAPVNTVVARASTANSLPPADSPPGPAVLQATDKAGAIAANGIKAAAQPDADRLMAALNELPPPAAGQAAAATPGSVTPKQTQTSSAQDVDLKTAQPLLLAKRETVPAMPAQPAPAAAPVQSPRTAKSGNWSINLGSFSKQAVADEMRGRFQKQGVAADKIVATVNGNTFYRLRMTGFDSKQAAIQESRLIKKKLGLKEAWVTRK